MTDIEMTEIATKLIIRYGPAEALAMAYRSGWALPNIPTAEEGFAAFMERRKVDLQRQESIEEVKKTVEEEAAEIAVTEVDEELVTTIKKELIV